MTTYRLYFGLKQRGRNIPPKAFDRFIETVVAPRLEGFTVYPAVGYWQGTRENTRVLEYVGYRDSRHVLKGIAECYAASFGQECVLLTGSPLIYWGRFDFRKEGETKNDRRRQDRR